MRSDEEIDDDIERRLQGYKDLRARLNLPPLTDDEQSRKSIFASEKGRDAAESRRQEHKRQIAICQEAWNHRVLVKHEDVTIVAKKGEVFSQTADGELTLLPAPSVPFEVNEVFDLNSVSGPIVEENGYAWTRKPEIAFFSSDGSRLTVHWVACAHEPKYGWEYSHAIVQRVTWGRVMVDETLSWVWLETIERSELHWGSSTEQWTSLCRP